MTNQQAGYVCRMIHTKDIYGPLNIVLPTNDNICEPDCICPIVFLLNQDCYTAELCSCIHNTVFTHTLSLCRTEPTNIQLCINNITDGMNGSRLHIFQSKTSYCQNSWIYSYRNYVKAFMILIAGIFTVSESTSVAR